MNVGDKAPEVLGINEKGEEIRLSDYKGKKIVLYFYPKDSTSGCTAQACSLRDGYSELRKSVSAWTAQHPTKNLLLKMNYPSH